jgi:hypothetical protein
MIDSPIATVTSQATSRVAELVLGEPQFLRNLLRIVDSALADGLKKTSQPFRV